jgi:hypothetical protein
MHDEVAADLHENAPPGLWLWKGAIQQNEPAPLRRPRLWVVCVGVPLVLIAVAGFAITLPRVLAPQPVLPGISQEPAGARPVPPRPALAPAPVTSDPTEASASAQIDPTRQMMDWWSSPPARMTVWWMSRLVGADPPARLAVVRPKTLSIGRSAQPFAHRPQRSAATTIRASSALSQGSLGCPPSICFP